MSPNACSGPMNPPRQGGPLDGYHIASNLSIALIEVNYNLNFGM